MLKRKLEGPVLVIPALILIAIVLIIPMLYSFYCSLFELKYMAPGNFIGLNNYIKLFSDPNNYEYIKITFIISFAAAAISLAIGTLLAIWVSKKKTFFGYSIEIGGLIPWVTSMVVAALLWKWVFDGEMGLVNYTLACFGIKQINFFSSSMAVATTTFVIAWRTIGYSMVMILAGLKGISQDIIEASSIDGANAFQTFWRIKLPSIKTPALISSIVLVLSNFNNNTIPIILTGGGPAGATNVISLEAYNLAFSDYMYGRASALSCIILVINILLVVFYIKAVRYKV